MDLWSKGFGPVEQGFWTYGTRILDLWDKNLDLWDKDFGPMGQGFWTCESRILELWDKDFGPMEGAIHQGGYYTTRKVLYNKEGTIQQGRCYTTSRLPYKKEGTIHPLPPLPPGNYCAQCFH